MEYILLLQLMITEIHPTPAAGEPEWVECVVASSSPLQLGQFFVCDNKSRVPLPSHVLAPGAMVVITRDAETLRESRVIPAGTAVVECALPSLNNTTDRVELRGRDSLIVDEVSYVITPLERGRSKERHGSSENGNVRYTQQWSASVAFDSATCGRINSHVEYENDIGVTGMFVQDSILNIGIVNYGRVSAPSQSVNVSIGQLRWQLHAPPLQSKQWWSTQIQMVQLAPTTHIRNDTVVVELTDNDMRSQNNTYRSTLCIPPTNGEIMISEVLAESDDGDCDFVEIWNGTTDTINVQDWTIEDDGGVACRIMSAIQIPPGEFLACASDTAIVRMSNGGRTAQVRPSLNVHAAQDALTLRTSSGFVVDRAEYDKSWHSGSLVSTRGRSLEKRMLRALNLPGSAESAWGSCTSTRGSTPGQSNSLAIEVQESDVVLSAMPSPFSTVESAARYPCIISWRQPFEQAIARMFVLRLDGSIVAELLNGNFIGRKGAISWSGLSSVTQAALPIGIYVAAFECVDALSSSVLRGTCPVVIGQSR